MHSQSANTPAHKIKDPRYMREPSLPLKGIEEVLEMLLRKATDYVTLRIDA
jgi:hypothetical protein